MRFGKKACPTRGALRGDLFFGEAGPEGERRVDDLTEGFRQQGDEIENRRNSH